ncbi:nuclear transport factor 2 family protein [Nocardioides sp. B-3]|nr:nuclear transport factor 2 family protein [Nocardioides sp. B-3]UUZ60918.1 nuclear transport factor 2 family protein [Nocardioides sp. B-3]
MATTRRSTSTAMRRPARGTSTTRVYAPAHDFALEGAALYSDRYVRTPDGWRMSHTGYERIFEKTRTPGDATIQQGARSRGENS